MLASLAPLSGCGDKNKGHRTTCADTANFATGSATGHAAPLGASATEARAGVLTAAMIPTRPSNEIEELRVWREGDFVLANDRVAMAIEAARPSDHFDPWGGMPVGLARVQGGAMVEPANFNELMFLLGKNTLHTESVTVMNDGTNGQPAVVRAVGTFASVPILLQIADTTLPSTVAGMRAAVDYSLAAGAEHVDVTMRVANTSETDLQYGTPESLALQFYTMPIFAPDDGFSPRIGIDYPYLAYVADGLTGYAIENLVPDAGPDALIQAQLSLSGANILRHNLSDVEFPTCTQKELPFARIHIGGAGIDGLRQAIARSDGQALRTITGTFTESNGTTPVVGAHVHARVDATHYLTRAVTDASGHYSLTVPDGQAVEILGFRQGFPVTTPVAVPAAQSSANLSLVPGATLAITVRDATTTPFAIPARIQVTPAAGAPAVPPEFGENDPGNGRMYIEFPTNGQVSLPVYASNGGAVDYDIVVSRGYEYDLWDNPVSVNPGGTQTVDVDLHRVVDTTGTLCGDFHVHTNRSPDAPDSVTRKVASAAADGLELPLRSDHEWVNDFDAEVQRVGLTNFVYGISSLELTTWAFGHFGVFPMRENTMEPNGGATAWYDSTSQAEPTLLTPMQIFDAVRAVTDATWGSPTLIVNHPRDSSFGFGYFTNSLYSYDAVTGTWTGTGYDEGFSLIEVFNDSGWTTNYTGNYARPRPADDWFSFLNRGLPMYAVGSSDSHGISGSPVGYPRTCVRVGTDSPSALRSMANGPGLVRDRVLAGAHSVSGGIYVDAVAAGGKRSGETVTGANLAGGENVTVTVQAAQWIDADTLKVYVDGTLQTTIPLPAWTPSYAGPVTRLSQSIPISFPSTTGRHWVVFVAEGDTSLGKIHPGRLPFGVTNPIFFTP